MINNGYSPASAAAMAAIKKNGSWFYLIAAFSAFRAFMNSTSGNTGISFYSLALTNLISGAGGLVIALVICGFWVFLGFQAGKAQKWAFVTGMALYGIDTLLMAGIAAFGGGVIAILGVAFHGYVIFRLFHGLQACAQLSAIAAQEAQIQATPAGTPGGWYAQQPQQAGQWPPAPAPPQPARPPPISTAQNPGTSSAPAAIQAPDWPPVAQPARAQESEA